MGEGKPVVTPAPSNTGAADPTQMEGVNTNLDPKVQGGPVTGADRAANQDIQQEHAETDVEQK